MADKKPIDEMTQDEILEEVAEYMAQKHGSVHNGTFEEAKAQAKKTMSALPLSHIKIMLENSRNQTPK